MKKRMYLPLPALAMLCAVGANSQTLSSEPGLPRYPTEKGSVLIGANLLNAAAGFGGNGYGSYYSISASPRAGYFLADNLVLGATINGTFQGGGGYQLNGIGAGAFARYYFGKMVDKDGQLKRLRFFAEGGLGYTTGLTKYREAGGQQIQRSFNTKSAYALAGFNYFVTKNIALEAGLSGQVNLRTGTYYGRPSQLGLNLGVQLFIPGNRRQQAKP